MTLTIEQRTEIEAGVRWTKNILTELLGNYGTRLPLHKREALRKAVTALNEYEAPAPKKENPK